MLIGYLIQDIHESAHQAEHHDNQINQAGTEQDIQQFRFVFQNKRQKDIPHQWRDETAKGRQHLLVEDIIVPRGFRPPGNFLDSRDDDVVEELRRQVRDDDDTQEAGNADAPGMDMDLFNTDARHQTGNGLVYCIHKRERLRLFRLNRLCLYDFLRLFMLFYLDMVETFSINTDDGTL